MPCWRCGRAVDADSPKTVFVHIVKGGGHIASVDHDGPEIGDSGDMGLYPVGGSCVRKIPVKFRHKLGGAE